MNKYLTKGRIALLVIFSVLIADQIIKIYVKTHMYWHQSENAIKWLYEKLGMVDAEPPTWFYIYFTENNGMAFGMEIFGKLFLTLFRIVAVGAIGWYLKEWWKVAGDIFRVGHSPDRFTESACNRNIPSAWH